MGIEGPSPPPPPPPPQPAPSVVCLPQGCTLTILYGGTGKGMVAASGWQEYYPKGTKMSLTARPFTGSKFLGWSGGYSGIGAVAVVTINTNLIITAHFALVSP